eukprot:gene10961-17073_t
MRGRMSEPKLSALRRGHPVSEAAAAAIRLTILPASPTLATLDRAHSALALEKACAAEALALEKARAAEALEVEKARAAKALEVEKARAAEALALEKECSTEALALEKARAAEALAREGGEAAERARTELERVLEMRVRAGVAEICAEERVHLRAVEAQLAALRDREVEKEVARRSEDATALWTQLAELEREMDILRRSNSARGFVGEERIASFLRREWPASENKAVVTRADVERFEADVASISERDGHALIGGVFVSCRSDNIPGKGPLKLEMMPGRGGSSIPLLFAAITDGQASDLAWLKGVLNVFLTVAQNTHADSAARRGGGDVEEDRHRHMHRHMHRGAHPRNQGGRGAAGALLQPGRRVQGDGRRRPR